MILQRIMKWVADHIRLAPMQILVIALLCSCGSSHKAQQSIEVVKIETSSSSADSSSVIKQNLITELDSSSEELHVTITEYDTALPVDSLTGKPPVKKEIKVNQNKGRKKQSEEKHDEQNQVVTRVAEQAQLKDSTSVQVVRIRQETSIPRQIGNLTKWVCVFVGLLIVWYLTRRYGRK